MDNTLQDNRELSRYTGGAIVRKLIGLVAFLVSFITLQLARPAMECWKQRYECRHTYIDGKRLIFDGNGLQLFGKFTVWLLLSVVTLGIYSFWLSVKQKKWIIKHTHIVTEEEAAAFDAAQKKGSARENLSGEEKAAYEAKLLEKKKQAHGMGQIVLLLTFVMPQFGLILGIAGIVFGAVYREKFCLRASVICVSILAVAVTVVCAFIFRDAQYALFAAAGALAAAAAAACTTAFIFTGKWESAPAKNAQ